MPTSQLTVTGMQRISGTLESSSAYDQVRQAELDSTGQVDPDPRSFSRHRKPDGVNIVAVV